MTHSTRLGSGAHKQISRIGKKPITVPAGVKMSLDTKTRTVAVDGPKGKLSFQYRPEVEVTWDEAEKHIICSITEEQTKFSLNRSLWGTTRACIQNILIKLEALDLLDDTIVVFTSDHGETLYDHECWFDHHGTYDCTLVVPLIIIYPKKMPAGERVDGYCQLKDLVPTLLDLADIEVEDKFDGHSLLPMANGEVLTHETELYITECTWMRKHGWRTPEWKLIVALEPDFHFKPPVELYNLLHDPEEYNNLADELPNVVEFLKGRMEAFIAKRTAETGLPNPMYHQEHWRNFTSSEEAYNALHIGNPSEAAKLQRKD